MRVRPLTVLLVLAGALVFLSHRLFVPTAPQRKIRKARSSRPHPHIPDELADAHVMDDEDDRAVGAREAAESTSAADALSAAARLEAEAAAEEGEGAPLEGSDEGEPEAEAHEDAKAPEEVAAGILARRRGGAAAAGALAPPPAVALASGALVPYPTAGVEFECKPGKVSRPTRPLNYVVDPEASEWPQNCAGREALCDVVRSTAINREVMVAVCNSNIIGQLAKWVESNRRASIENMLIISIDARLPTWLKENKVAYWERTTSAAGSHKISAQKFMFVQEFLTIGCSVLMSDIDVVYLQNPFLFLHKDSDVEGTTDGWDDGSAYGWTETLDDPSLGAWGRFRPAMRITAWNSGLWYARATRASLNLMTILSNRMATEDTWDQAAFGEEMSRPARDDHLAAGITKRALNHWCFANSKTLFRRVRVEPRFKDHVPVVVHANYHQPKEPRMRAVYDRWHLLQPDALDRFPTEQAFTVPPQKLEEDFLHMINDGFVSGANTQAASQAVAAHGCDVQASKHGVVASLHRLPPAACAAADAPLCEAAAAVASRRAKGAVAPELVLLMGGAADGAALKIALASAASAGVVNLLLLLTDAKSVGGSAAHAALGADAPPTSGAGPRTAMWPARGPGPRGASLAKWAALRALYGAGYAVLFALPSTVFLSNPFEHLYRDADVEAMSTGWDDGSAYGYNHVLDDPSMGFTRFCHGSRIVAYEPGFFYGQPTAEALALAVRMATHAAALPDGASAADVYPAEREAFLHELWLPSHHEYASVGAQLRVMNYLCFVNSKVLFRQTRMLPSAPTPVAVQINFHTDVAPRMAAVVAKYGAAHDGAQLAALPLADTGGAGGAATSAASCVRGAAGAADAGLGAAGSGGVAEELVRRSPYAWGGIGDIFFHEGGSLKTPWGDGQWGAHAADGGGRSFFADFVGAKHNVLVLESGMGISTRCADNNVVLVRSIKAAKAKA